VSSDLPDFLRSQQTFGTHARRPLAFIGLLKGCCWWGSQRRHISVSQYTKHQKSEPKRPRRGWGGGQSCCRTPHWV